MRVFAVAVLIAGVCLSGFAQEKNNAFKVKHTTVDKPAKKIVVPNGKSTAVGTSAAANSKDLQTIERQTAHSSAPHATGPRGPKAAAVKPLKENSNGPIKVGGTNGASGGQLHQSANPYKGRLKQKNTRQ